MNRMLSAAFAVATLAGASAPVHAADATEKQILLSLFTLAAAHMACPNIEVNNGRDGDAGWALTNSVDESYKKFNTRRCPCENSAGRVAVSNFLR